MTADGCNLSIRTKSKDTPTHGRPERSFSSPHTFSHNLKRIAARHSPPVLFSASSRLSSMGLWLAAKRSGESRERNVCSISESLPLVDCVSGVLYEIPFSCGKVDIRETGTCLSARILEHYNTLKATLSRQFALHVRDCHYIPCLAITRVPARSSENVWSRFFYYRQSSHSYINSSSLAL